MRRRKTTIYPADEDRARLVRLANARGTTQADVIRQGLRALERAELPDRNSALAGHLNGHRVSARDVPDDC
jgi:hypothetical protein